MRKISLIANYRKSINIKEWLSVPYYKIYILKRESIEISKNLSSSNRIQIHSYSNENEIKWIIKRIIEKSPDEYLIPYFTSDRLSKYSIYTNNQYSSNEVDWRTFRYKNKMNEFIGMNKKNLFIPHEKLSQYNYDSISKEINENIFIIKPINLSSSAGAFKITSHQDREDIKSKLLKTDHIVEEYFWWYLHSLDFYCDGEKILLLTAVKEMPFIEILDEKRLSNSFMNTYWSEIEKHFLYFLPIRYDIPTSKLRDEEWKFLEEVGKKLISIGYKWIIHLEYKYDPNTKKVGFIERGARLGGERVNYLKKINYFDMASLLYDIHNGDTSKRKKYKWSYILKDSVNDLHYIWIYKNFIKKTTIGEILTNHKNFFKVSFIEHLNQYFYSIGLEVKNLQIITTGNQKDFYPSYEWKSTFRIFFEVDDENFKKFTKKKITILEQIVF